MKPIHMYISFCLNINTSLSYESVCNFMEWICRNWSGIIYCRDINISFTFCYIYRRVQYYENSKSANLYLCLKYSLQTHTLVDTLWYIISHNNIFYCNWIIRNVIFMFAILNYIIFTIVYLLIANCCIYNFNYMIWLPSRYSHYNIF